MLRLSPPPNLRSRTPAGPLVQATATRVDRCWIVMLSGLTGSEEKRKAAQPEGGWDIPTLLKKVSTHLHRTSVGVVLDARHSFLTRGTLNHSAGRAPCIVRPAPPPPAQRPTSLLGSPPPPTPAGTGEIARHPVVQTHGRRGADGDGRE